MDGWMDSDRLEDIHNYVFIVIIEILKIIIDKHKCSIKKIDKVVKRDGDR